METNRLGLQVLNAPLRYSARDNDLRDRVFRCRDPEALEALVLEPPNHSGRPIIEFQYDLTPSKHTARGKIRCAHCGFPNHWKGIVVRYPDGKRILVGKDCGKKLYGAAFTQIERDFDQRERRQIQLKRLANIINRLPALRRFIDRLSARDCVRRTSRLRSFIEKASPALYSQLRRAAEQNSGLLVVTERVRDYAAEATRKGGGNGPIFARRIREVGRLSGRAVFTANGELVEQRLRHAQEKVEYCAIQLRDRQESEYWTGVRLKTLFSALEDAVRTIEAQMSLVEAYASAIAPQNLQLIAAWATLSSDVPGNWSYENQHLVSTNADAALHFPPASQNIETSDLAAFTRALRMQDDTREGA